ncbi:MAG: hypothetical protein CMG64_05160 [Candidatus Marinimicrobia bacterium]|nr:hypothetical protein [Candidatus Neomarinimicrobiota bacterium]|tara:strand:- start:9556 stop:10383 length:828 start_codon:yes stop_codon:yes gene_type:complete
MKYKFIKDLSQGDQVKSFFFCEQKNLKKTRFGDQYLDLIIIDKTGSMKAKIWKHVDFYNDKFDEKEPIAVKGEVISYRKQLEIDIKNISAVSDDNYDIYGYDSNLIIDSIDDSVNELWSNILSTINSLSPKHKKIIKTIYSSYKDSICSFPGTNSSYNLKGGYLKQLAKVLSIFDALINLYSSLDRNKIIAGIFLKNIGSVSSYNNDVFFTKTQEGELLNIQVLGLKLLNEKFSSLVKDKDNLLFYNHVISSDAEVDDLELKFINMLYDIDYKLG